MTVSTRISDSCDDECDFRNRFYVPLGSCSFKVQFAGIYNCRLTASKPTLEASAIRKWTAGSARLPFRALSDIKLNEECVIIGTLYKEMRLKPTVIRQLAEIEQGGFRKPGAIPLFVDGLQVPRLTADEDEIFLEDEVQRIGLRAHDCQAFGNCKVIASYLVTGVVVALRGLESESYQGYFSVMDAIFLEPGPMRPIEIPSLANDSKQSLQGVGPCVAFASGLGFVGSGTTVSETHGLALRLFGDWLRGAVTLTDTSVSLVQLVILGDSIQIAGGDESETIGLIQQARYLTRKTDADSVTAVAAFDTWLSELPLSSPGTADERNGFSVCVLPGPADCVSHLLPQQPFHSSVFPKALARAGGVGSGALRSTTNPLMYEICSRKILATAGQAITDILQYTRLRDPLDCMEASLHWGHIAPTCPDTLFGYPLVEKDLLLFRTESDCCRSLSNVLYNPSFDYPDVYVAGNQPKAAFKRASLSVWVPPEGEDEIEHNGSGDGALLISVPRFDTTHTIVLLELETLRCVPVRFDLSDLIS